MSWGLLCIGVLTTFNHLRQQLGEPRPVASAENHISLFATTKPAFSPLPAPTSPVPAIAIIIDDLGEQWQAGKRAIELPGDITLAILPFSTHGRRLAEIALQQGREVMLHAPMEPLSHPAWRDGLTRSMTKSELRRELHRMLGSLPLIRGVNNHMGSALTQEREAMDWVMAELAPRVSTSSIAAPLRRAKRCSPLKSMLYPVPAAIYSSTMSAQKTRSHSSFALCYGWPASAAEASP